MSSLVPGRMQSSWDAIAMKTCKKRERKVGVWEGHTKVAEYERGERGMRDAPQYLRNCKKVGQNVSHAAGELATVFSMTFYLVTVVGQMARSNAPSQWTVSRYISDGLERPGTPYKCNLQGCSEKKQKYHLFIGPTKLVSQPKIK